MVISFITNLFLKIYGLIIIMPLMVMIMRRIYGCCSLITFILHISCHVLVDLQFVSNVITYFVEVHDSPPSPDGPVLIHTNTGDLLRSLDPPNRSPPNQAFLRPHLLSLNREGYVVVSYEKGGLCSFTINGKIQRYVTHNDNLQVCADDDDDDYVVVVVLMMIIMMIGVDRSNQSRP